MSFYRVITPGSSCHLGHLNCRRFEALLLERVGQELVGALPVAGLPVRRLKPMEELDSELVQNHEVEKFFARRAEMFRSAEQP